MLLWNKGREDGREKKGECIRRHGFRALRCECHREQYRRVGEHPVIYQSLLFRFYFLCCPPSRLFTQIASSSPTRLFFPLGAAACCCRNSRERGPWDLQTPNLLLSSGCQGCCCHSKLRYDNCAIYTCNSWIKSALCSASVFYLCHTHSLPLQWFLHPNRIDGNKTWHQAWVIHANCLLWNIHAVTFLNKSICLYPPSAECCWSKRKDQVQLVVSLALPRRDADTHMLT